MSTRPRQAMTKASAFLVGTIIVACPPAMSDALAPAIDRSLEECSSNLKENATGWQRLQLVLASRDDWVEMCAKQIQSDLRAAADRDYESGDDTDQRFRQRMDEISKYVPEKITADIGGSEYGGSSVERFVVVDGNGKSQRSDESAGKPAIETLPGYEVISK